MVDELPGVELFGLLLLGVEVDDGFVVLFGFVVSVLLELLLGVADVEEELLDGEVASGVLLVLDDGELEFMSELLDGEVVLDGEVEVLDPVWLDDVDGVLWVASVLLELVLLL